MLEYDSQNKQRIPYKHPFCYIGIEFLHVFKWFHCFNMLNQLNSRNAFEYLFSPIMLCSDYTSVGVVAAPVRRSC
jgi:hypothetical protein